MHPLRLKQQPGKLLYLRPWYGVKYFQRKGSFLTDRCAFYATASEQGVLRRLSWTEAALLKSIFQYCLQLLWLPSCLCVFKLNLFHFQPKELHCYNRMKGAIIILGDLKRKWSTQPFSSHLYSWKNWVLCVWKWHATQVIFFKIHTERSKPKENRKEPN